MKRVTLSLFTSLFLFTPAVGHCDMFGGDVVVLSQILVNALQQLSQLKAIVNSGKDSLDLMRDINKGINDSINLIRTVSPNTAAGIYSEWQKINQAQQGIESIYGKPISSPEIRVQQ